MNDPIHLSRLRGAVGGDGPLLWGSGLSSSRLEIYRTRSNLLTQPKHKREGLKSATVLWSVHVVWRHENKNPNDKFKKRSRQRAPLRGVRLLVFSGVLGLNAKQ